MSKGRQQQQQRRSRAAGLVLASVMLVVGWSTLTVPTAEALVVGPDGFGHVARDSAESNGPVYAFQDISTSGTSVLSSCDDCLSGAVPIPFPFEFYGVGRSALYASSNGFLAFTDPLSDYCCDGHVLPSSNAPPAMVAGWWRDLQLDAHGITVAAFGTSPNQYMIVQWNAVEFSSGLTAIFQIKLFEGSNNIEVHYADVSATAPVTMGIQDDTRSIGLTYGHFSSQALASHAVLYSPPEVVLLGEQLPQGLSGATAVWAGQHAYIFGGCTEYGCPSFTNAIVRYDPVLGVLTTLNATLPVASDYASGIWDGGTGIYIFGGRIAPGTNLADIVRFDIVSETVTTLSTQLPSARSMTAAVFDGTHAYVFGGQGGGDDIVRFTPATGALTVLSTPLPTPLYRMSAVWTGSEAYILGGYSSAPTNQILRFTPSPENVTVMPEQLPSAVYQASAVWGNGAAYHFGGAPSNDDIVQYVPGVGATLLTHTLPSNRWATAGFWDGQAAYVLGGIPDGTTWLREIVRFGPNSTADILPPVTTILVNAIEGENGWLTSPTEVAFSCADHGSGCASTTYRINGGAWNAYSGSPIAIPEGTTLIEYHSVDNAGNLEEIANATLRVDVTPPSVSAHSDCPVPGSNGWCRAGFTTITASATDATSGGARVVCSIDGGPHGGCGILGTGAAQVGALPSARTAAPAVWHDGAAFTFGGHVLSNEIRRYDQATGQTSVVATLPEAGYSRAVASDGTYAYVIGGYDGTGPISAIYRFDLESYALSRIGTLPQGIYSLAAAYVGGSIYTFGGNTNLDVIYRIDPTTGGVTTMSARLPVGQDGMGVATDGTDVYLFGGVANGVNTDKIYRYGPSTDTIAQVGTLPAATRFPGAVYDGAQFHVIGGGSGGVVVGTIHTFDPATLALTTRSFTLPVPVMWSGVAWTGNDAILLGGETNGAISSAIQRVGFRDGSAGVVAVRATDLAGNEATTSLAVRLDATAPLVNATATCLAGQNGWCRDAAVPLDVTVEDVGTVAYATDFAAGPDAGWSTSQSETTPYGGDRFLGRFINENVTLTLGALPPHETLTLELDVYAIQSWDAWEDYFEVYADGRRVMRTAFDTILTRTQCYPADCEVGPGSYAGRTGAYAINRQGFPTHGSSEYRFSLNIPHNASSVVLAFRGQMNSLGLHDESWGIDNLRVLVDASGVARAQPTCTLAGAATRCGVNATAEGVYELAAQGRDHAGHAGYSNLTLRLDRTPPVPGASAPCPHTLQNGWCRVDNRTITTSPVETGSGLLNRSCRVNSINVSCASHTVGQGAHSAYYDATDVAGNYGWSSFPVWNDNVPPSLFIHLNCTAAGADGWCAGSFTGYARGEDATSGFASSPVCDVDGVVVACNSVAISDSGVHVFTITAEDRAGNVAIASQELRIDGHAPSAPVVLDCPTPGLSGWCRASAWLRTLAAESAGMGSVLRAYDFSSPPSDGAWSHATTSTSPNGRESFLGVFTQVENLTFNATGLPAHRRLVAEFDVYTPRTWDGNSATYGPDYFLVGLGNGDVLYNTTFSNTGSNQCYPSQCPASYGARTNATGVNQLGYSINLNTVMDASYRISVAFDHSDENLTLWLRHNAIAADGEQWGIDNFRLYADVSGLASTECSMDGQRTRCIRDVATDGNRTFNATVADVAGNARTSSVDVKIDTTAPTLDIQNACGATFNAGWCRTDVETFVTATDAMSGVSSIACTRDGQSIACAGISTTSEGAHTIVGNATDVAGNFASASSGFSIDKTQPVVWLNLTCDRVGDAGWCLGNVTYAPASSDALSGVASNACTLDGVAIACATGIVNESKGYTAQIVATDVAGNARGTTVAWSIDSIPPWIDLDVRCGDGFQNEWCGGPVFVNASAADGLSGLHSLVCGVNGVVLACANLSIQLEGVHTFVASARDVAGNYRNETRTIRIDATPPVAAHDAACAGVENLTWCSAGWTVNVSATDAASGLATLECQLDGAVVPCDPVGISSEGGHQLTVLATDLAGNLLNETRPYGVDLTAPVLGEPESCVLGNGDWCVSTRYSNVTSADALSGVASTACTLDNVTIACTNIVLEDDGVYFLSATTQDLVANTRTGGGELKVDKTPPSINITETCATPGASGWCRSDVELQVTLADATSGVDTSSCLADGASVSCALTHQFATDGQHTLEVAAQDVAGNHNNETRTVHVDATAPVTGASLSGATSVAGWFKGPVTVTLSASDATSGVAATYYRIDGGATQTYAGAFAIGADGVTRVEHWSVDVAGNAEATETTTVAIDTTAPLLEMSTMCPVAGLGEWCRAPNVTYRMWANDTLGGAATIYSNTFDAPVGTEWSSTSRTTFRTGETALGVFPARGDPVTLTLSSLPEHDVLTVEVDLLMNGSWDGIGNWCCGPDTWRLETSDGRVLLNTSFSNTQVNSQCYPLACPAAFAWRTEAVGVNVLRDPYPSEGDAGYRIALSFPHNGSTVGLRFVSTGADLPDEYWSLDNVRVLADASGADGPAYACAVNGVTTPCWKIQPGQGALVLSGSATDRAGNAATLANRTVWLDNVAPFTSIALNGTLGNLGWFRSAVVATLTATDATSGVASTQWRIDGHTSYATYTGPFTIDLQGSNTLRAWSSDVAGNAEGPRVAGLKIDTVAPTTTHALSGTLGNNGIYTSGVTVTLAGTDATSGVNATYYSIDGGALQTYLGAFTVTKQGLTTIAYHSEDVAGNTGTASSTTFEIDTVAPETTHALGTQPNAYGWWNAPVEVTLNASEPGATYYQIDGGAQQTYVAPFLVTGNGTFNVEYWSVDEAGNVESKKSVLLSIDQVPPALGSSESCALAGTNGWCRGEHNVSATFSDTPSGIASIVCLLDGVSKDCASSHSTVADGYHNYTIDAVDRADNAASRTHAFKIDATAPATTPTLVGTEGANGWYVGDVSVTLDASDALSGVAQTLASLDGAAPTEYVAPILVTGNGVHRLEFWSVDAAGNAEATQNRTIRIDGLAPVVTITPDCDKVFADGWCSGNLTVSAAATDAHSGVATLTCEMNGARVDCAGVAVTNTTRLPFYANATDDAGNVHLDSRLYAIDHAPPLVNIMVDCTTWGVLLEWCVTPDLGFTTHAFDFGGSGIVAYDCSFNGAPSECTVVTGAEGRHTFAYTAYDRVDNNASVQDTLGVDTVPPSTSATLEGTIGPNGDYNTSVIVRLPASDATSGLKETHYRDQSMDQDTHVVYAGGINVTREGPNTIQYRSVDVAGNVEPWQWVNFTIDTIPPSTTRNLTGTRGDSGWYVSNVTLSLASTGEAVATYLEVDGVVDSYVAPVTFVGSGEPIVRYWSVDGAGNVEAPHAFQLHLDQEAPSIDPAWTCDGVANGSWCSGNVTFAATATDATSGVSLVECTLDGATVPCDAALATDQGTHAFAATARDVAGNTANAGIERGVDRVLPGVDIAIACPAWGDNGWCSASHFNYTASATDAHSGVQDGFPACSVDGAAAPCAGTLSPGGVYTIDVDARDNVDNAHAARLVQGLDDTAPTTASTLTGLPGLDAWWKSAVTVALAATDDVSGVNLTRYAIDGGAEQTYAQPFEVAKEGATTLSYHSVDVAGNVETPREEVVLVDTVRPESAVSISGLEGDAGWHVGPVTVVINATDATSGVREIRKQDAGDNPDTSGPVYSAPFVVTGEGNHTITATAHDFAGWDEDTPSSAFFRIDTIAPACSVSFDGAVGENGWYLSTGSFSVASADAMPGSGILGVWYAIDDGAWTPYAGPVSFALEGNHTVACKVQDVAGHVSSATLPLPLDTRDPLVSIDAWCVGADLVRGWCPGGSYAYAMNASDPAPGSTLREVTCLDNAEATACAGEVLLEGVHALDLVATDVAGRTSNATRTVMLDHTPPELPLPWRCETPLQNGWCGSRVVVSPAPQDAHSGIHVSECVVDRTVHACSGDILVPWQGNHTAYLNATDVAGNANATLTTFRVDSIPPVIAFPAVSCAAPGTPGWCRAESFSFDFRGAANDSMSGLSGAPSCSVDGAAPGPCVGTVAGNGTHTIVLTASDAAGNVASATFTMRIDATPPVLTGASPGRAGEVVLRWSAPADEGRTVVSGYRIYRSSSENGTFVAAADVGNTTSFVDGGLNGGATYHYRVAAISDAGLSPWSGVLNATTLGVPGIPRDLDITGTTSTVNLTWSPPSSDGGSNVTGYRVFRGVRPGEVTYRGEVDAQTLRWTEPFSDPNEEQTGTVYYRVSAFNAVGAGALSPERSYTPTPVRPPPPPEETRPPERPAAETLSGLGPYKREWSRTAGVESPVDSTVAAVLHPDGSLLYEIGPTRAGGASSDFRILARETTSGGVVWEKTWDSGGNDVPNAIAIDSFARRVYVTGFANGDAAVVALHASNGTLAWTRTFVGADGQGDAGTAIAVNYEATRVYVAGWTGVAGAYGDMYAMAYAADTGTPVWPMPFTYGTPLEDAPVGIVVDRADRRVHVTGTSGADMATVAIDASTGTQQWVRRHDGGMTDRAAGIALAPDGRRVYVAGSIGTNAGRDFATIAYNATTGAQLWLRLHEGRAALSSAPLRDDVARAIAVAPDGGRVVVAGTSSGGTTTGMDVAVVAYDAGTGTRAWAITRDVRGSDDQANAVTLSRDSLRVLVVGRTWSPVAANYDPVVLGLDATTGTEIWHDFVGGTGDEDAVAVVASPDARVYVVGSTGGPRATRALAIGYVQESPQEGEEGDGLFAGVAFDPAPDAAPPLPEPLVLEPRRLS